MVENALARRSRPRARSTGLFEGLILNMFWIIFWSLFGKLLKPILGPILGPDRPKRGQDEPKRLIRSFKEPKSCIFKNLKKPCVFQGFWVQRPPRRSSRGPRRLPRGTQRAPKNQKKKIQNLTQKLTNFGPILGSKKVSKTPLKRLKNKKQNCYPIGHPSPTSQGSK